MSINKYKKHIIVLPEDDANRQIANGFCLHPNLDQRVIQILPPPGGWTKVRDSFRDNHVSGMRKYQHRMMLLLIDFDLDEDRFDNVRNRIPEDLIERVFILGALSEPENLKRSTGDLNTYEKIGKALHKTVSKIRTTYGDMTLSGTTEKSWIV